MIGSQLWRNSLGSLFLCLCLVLPVLAAENPDRVDGKAWVAFTADYKLVLIRGTQEEVRRAGLTTRYTAEFYLKALDAFYSQPENRDIGVGDAMSFIGFPLGDFEDLTRKLPEEAGPTT